VFDYQGQTAPGVAHSVFADAEKQLAGGLGDLFQGREPREFEVEQSLS
jgi:hypothetical protein